jgi:hypothetical protein
MESASSSPKVPFRGIAPRKIPGIGPRTANLLQEQGILSMEHLNAKLRQQDVSLTDVDQIATFLKETVRVSREGGRGLREDISVCACVRSCVRALCIRCMLALVCTSTDARIRTDRRSARPWAPRSHLFAVAVSMCCAAAASSS